MIAPAHDLDRLMALMEASFDPHFREAWTRKQVEDSLVVGNCTYRLVTPEGEDAGPNDPVAGFSFSRRVIDEEELLLIAVSPDHRRKGLARILIERLIESARENGILRVFLEMRMNNEAETLYRACGFEPIGRRPDYYRTTSGQRLDAITFARIV